MSGNWIEIAYGTSSGAVRVIVQHPETVGSGPQLFQTFTVHRSPVTKIMLSEKHLVSGEEGLRARGKCTARGFAGNAVAVSSVCTDGCLCSPACQCVQITTMFVPGR